MNRPKDTKVVSIIQSSYIPWKGYFEIIDQSDVFILLDDVQFTKRDWRSRNKIPSADGGKWLTIPVQVKGKYTQQINETLINDSRWMNSHLGQIESTYRQAPYFKQQLGFVRDLYRTAIQESLSDINFHFLTHLCAHLGIDTPITWSTDYGVETEDATDRLVKLCVAENATEYISGPAAKSYLDEKAFNASGVSVKWFDYDGYKEYDQLYPPFNQYVAIIDILFMCGDNAIDFIRRPS